MLCVLRTYEHVAVNVGYMERIGSEKDFMWVDWWKCLNNGKSVSGWWEFYDNNIIMKFENIY